MFVSGINNTWVRHCHVIENCATTDHETSFGFICLGRQKNRPFQLRFEDGDWLNFMSHLEYIYILNQDLTKFYKDPPPVGWNRDVLTGSESILWWWKHIFFTEDFPIYHIIHLNNWYNYYFVCVVQGGWRPSALYWPAATAVCVFSRDRSPVRTSCPDSHREKTTGTSWSDFAAVVKKKLLVYVARGELVPRLSLVSPKVFSLFCHDGVLVPWCCRLWLA